MNPLKWPSFEQLGREVYDQLQPALAELAAGAQELEPKTWAGVQRLASWLESPCVATVKLDGTNVGVDQSGLIVGRNSAVEPGESYQKVRVWELLAGYAEKAEQLRLLLQEATGGESVQQLMLYGELVVNSKYDYAEAGIFKSWLCFGVVLRPGSEATDAAERLSTKLRQAGYNTKARKDCVVLAPSTRLAAQLQELGICTVAGGYRPSGAGSEAEWSEHHCTGGIPRFQSLHSLLASAWLGRFLKSEAGTPLGEGVVVASEADGTLFKLKHGGEELGKVPEQLEELVRSLERLATVEPAVRQLPPGLLEFCRQLHRIATTRPAELARALTAKTAKKPKASEEDQEALAVYESALTKVDNLEQIFGKGSAAKAAIEQELQAQVAQDLVKDYGAHEKDARMRASKVVCQQVGRRFGAWKKAQASSA